MYSYLHRTRSVSYTHLLIPLGPWLAALGSGDIVTLAEALTVSFDTTVTGLVIGAPVSYTHLDVYKRQVQIYLCALMVDMGRQQMDMALSLIHI